MGGTGEKALFCALRGAKADAFDLSETSIRIARENAARLKLPAVYSVDSFEQFSPGEKYDLILCIGSLHHSADPEGNFRRMARLLSKDGRIALGLYNLYGRLGCRLHRKLLWLGEENPSRVLGKLKLGGIESETMRASLADRYASPHESYHSIGEVLCWFRKANLSPVSCHPRASLSSPLFSQAAELTWLAKGKGFFYIGAKRGDQG